MGRRTAYIELNTSNQIYSLSVGRIKKNFTYHGITFYPCVTVTSLPEILNKDFDFFILDMGVLNIYTAKVFANCDKQFLVCSLVKWKEQQTLERITKLFEQTYLHQEQIVFLNNLQTKGSTLFSTFKHRISIPFIPNPFQIETQLFHVFHQILERKN